MQHRVSRALASLPVLLLMGCVTSEVKLHDPTQAVITIEDKLNAWNNLYRYVVWNGEGYGPKAFVSVARGKSIREIILVNGDASRISCARALGRKIGVPVVTDSTVTGGASEYPPNAAASMSSCEIPENIPHPALGADEYYVVVAQHKISIEGQEPMNFKSFPTYLKDINASAIVMRKATIADVLCLRAIAAAADVELKEVNLDGSIASSKVYGQEVTIAKACNQE